MIASHKMPKYLQIFEALIAGIRANDYSPQGKLPPLRELAQQFSTTVVTISKAVDMLCKDGWVICKHGKGIYIADRLPKHSLRVGLLLHCQGHLFSNIFSALSSGLQEAGHEITTTDLHNDALSEQRIKHALQGCPEALIIDGDARFPFDLLPPNTRTTFIFRCETAVPPAEANRVLADFPVAGVLAARHLLAQGIKKAVYYGFWSKKIPCENGLGPEYYYQHQLFKGFENEMNKGECKLTRILQNSPLPQEALCDVITKGTGIFCAGDYIAVQIYQLCAERGLKIGKDVKILGLFDTPWCSALTPELSSISVNEAELSAQAERLTSTRAQGKLLLVKPLLRARASSVCQGKNSSDLKSANEQHQHP